MYGNCVECGFPILVQSAEAVICPGCQTKNAPVEEISGHISGPEILVPFIVPAILLAIAILNFKKAKVESKK